MSYPRDIESHEHHEHHEPDGSHEFHQSNTQIILDGAEVDKLFNQFLQYQSSLGWCMYYTLIVLIIIYIIIDIAVVTVDAIYKLPDELPGMPWGLLVTVVVVLVSLIMYAVAIYAIVKKDQKIMYYLSMICLTNFLLSAILTYPVVLLRDLIASINMGLRGIHDVILALFLLGYLRSLEEKGLSKRELLERYPPKIFFGDPPTNYKGNFSYYPIRNFKIRRL